MKQSLKKETTNERPFPPSPFPLSLSWNRHSIRIGSAVAQRGTDCLLHLAHSVLYVLAEEMDWEVVEGAQKTKVGKVAYSGMLVLVGVEWKFQNMH